MLHVPFIANFNHSVVFFLNIGIPGKCQSTLESKIDKQQCDKSDFGHGRKLGEAFHTL